MQTEEFIRRVARAAEIDSQEAARKITFATIEALCLHLSKEETRQMASQLPRELSQAALNGRHQAGEPKDRVELAQFYSEVAQRVELDAEDVEGPARAVIDTLKNAISTGEFVDVTFNLPPELKSLMAR